MCGETVRHPITPIQGQPFVLIKPLFSEIGSKGMILALALGALHVWGLSGLVLNGCGPNLCFLKAFEQNTRFPWWKSSDMSPYFCGEN